MSVFLVLAGNALQNIYIPIYGIELGFTPFQVSLLGSLYFFGFFAGCLLVPPYLYSVGHIRTFAAFAAMAAVSAIVISISNSIGLWLPLRILSGFSLAALYISIESWISAFSTDDNRGRVLSVYRIVDLSGAILGQAVLFFMTGESTTLSLVACLIMISLIPISLTQIQMPALVQAVPEQLVLVMRKTRQMAPISLWGGLLSGVIAGVFWSLIPVFVEGVGHKPSSVPLVVSAYLIGGSLLQWPAGILSDRIDRRKVIVILCLIAASASVLMTVGAVLGKLNLPTLLLLVAFFGAGGIPVYPIAVAHANDWVKSASVVDLSVLLLVSSSIGSVLGPLMVGLFLNHISPQYFFLTLLGTHVLLMVLTSYRIVRYPPITESRKSEFHDFPETTPMIATVVDESDGST